MKNIVIAGATGYLGQHLVDELKNKKYSFKAIARNNKKLLDKELKQEQIVQAEVTNSNTLKGKLDGADVVISTVGITRQKDGLTFMDVDFQANLNLLNEAKKAGVKKFIYVSVVNGEKMRHLKIMEAKEKFVDVLKSSGMDYMIIRPNGFFSDLKDFLDMAQKGRVYLFGDGNYKLNPIHGADLAKGIIEAIDLNQKELLIGGPDLLTQNEIAQMALQSCGKSVKISHIPDWIRRLIINILRKFTSSKTYGPIEFFLSMGAQDNITPRTGIHRIQTFYKEEVDKIK